MVGVVVSGMRIDDGDRSSEDQAGSAAGCCCGSRRTRNEMVSEAHPTVGQWLTFGDASPNEPDDFRGFSELAVMHAVAGLDLGQIDDRNLVFRQFLLVGIGLGVDRTQPGNVAPDPAREGEGSIIAGYEQGEPGGADCPYPRFANGRRRHRHPEPQASRS